MKKMKKKIPRPVNGFFSQPIAVVQVLRHGRWFNINWVHADSKIKCTTTVLADELGTVKGVRVKYLQK